MVSPATIEVDPVEAYMDGCEDDPLTFYLHSLKWMSSPQREFFEDSSSKRFCRKGNKIGFSYHSMAEGAAISQGLHPVIERPIPNTTICYVPDLDNSYADDICVNLRKWVRDEDISKRCKYLKDEGFKVGKKRGLQFKNGSDWIFRSSHQQPGTQRGIFATGCVIINEPPAEHLWGEITRAWSMDERLPVLMNFTVIDDIRKEHVELAWLKKEIGNPKKRWSEHVVPLRFDTCPHRSRASIQRQMDDCPEWEYAQRIDAEWDTAAIDRIFVGFDDRPYADGGCVVNDADLAEMAPEVVQIGLGFDHAERPGGEIAILGCFWTAKGTAHGVVLDCYVSSGRTTPATDASFVLGLLADRGLSPLSVDVAKGDHNSAGKSSLTNINRELELAFAAALDSSVPPFSIEKARKGQGSVMYGVRVLNNALANSRLFVHERAKPLIHSLNNWRGKEMHKDAIDAARYLFTELLDLTRGGAAEIRLG